MNDDGEGLPTDNEVEHFAIELSDAAKTYHEWLCIVKFGMPTLIQQPRLLMEIIVRRAEIMCKENQQHVSHRCPADDAHVIMDDLGLKFELAGNGP